MGVAYNLMEKGAQHELKKSINGCRFFYSIRMHKVDRVYDPLLLNPLMVS